MNLLGSVALCINIQMSFNTILHFHFHDMQLVFNYLTQNNFVGIEDSMRLRILCLIDR